MAKKSTPRGQSGNAAQYYGIPMRQWAAKSYSVSNGRAASSLGDQNNQGSPSTTHAEFVSRQMPDDGGQNGAPGFGWCTSNRTQNSQPVRQRKIG